MKETSGASRGFFRAPVVRSRTLEKAMEEEEDEDDTVRKRRQKEFERNLHRAKHEVPVKATHVQHKKLDTNNKAEADDFRFV